MHARSAPDIRNAPIAFWRIAESFLNVLYCLFGGPEDVARQHTFTRKSHNLLASWLRAGEAMLRRLLLIEAAAVEATHTHAMPSPRTAQASDACVSPPAADDPATWRVSFRCVLDRRRPRRRRARGPGKEVRFLSAWPLAQRYEAMLRVFSDPSVYARRLARRLRADPRLVAFALRAGPEYGHRVDRADELTEEARRAWTKPDSS